MKSESSLATSDLLPGGIVSPTCGDADVDIRQRGQVASPGEETVAHLNKRKMKINSMQKRAFRLNLSQD